MNRRSFLGALAGMPIAAVVQPRVSMPEVTTLSGPCFTLKEAYPRVKSDLLRGDLRLTISCDTSEFRRECQVAAQEIQQIEQRLRHALHRGIRVESPKG